MPPRRHSGRPASGIADQAENENQLSSQSSVAPLLGQADPTAGEAASGTKELRVTQAFWEYSKAKGASVRLVLLALAWHADGGGDPPWPSRAMIAEYLHVSVRSVSRALAKLVAQGEIVAIGKTDDGTVMYRLTSGGRPIPDESLEATIERLGGKDRP